MSTPINELDLQRCVDGELPSGQRRLLLEQVDQAENGWKSLALAFLEHQDFTAASSEFRNGPAVVPSTTRVNPPAPRSAAFPLMQSLTLAASVAVAFWLGSRSGNRQILDDPGVPPVVATTGDGPRAQPTFAPETEGSTSLASYPQPAGRLQPTAVLKLPFTGEQEEELSIPVYDQKMLASDEGPEIPLWPAFDKPSALSQPGYRVMSEKNLLSIPLASGDTVVVPVEVSGVTYAVQ